MTMENFTSITDIETKINELLKDVTEEEFNEILFAVSAFVQQLREQHSDFPHPNP